MKPPKKIDDTLLLQLSAQGTLQKDMAERFGVSVAAVSKRLRRLQQPQKAPLLVEAFTVKEQTFCREIAAGKSQSAAAAAAFNVGSMDSAKSIGHRLMKSPEIQEAVTELMERKGIGRNYRVDRLKDHMEHCDPSVSLRALDMGFRLADDYPAAKNMNLNLNADSLDPVDLSKYLG